MWPTLKFQITYNISERAKARHFKLYTHFWILFNIPTFVGLSQFIPHVTKIEVLSHTTVIWRFLEDPVVWHLLWWNKPCCETHNDLPRVPVEEGKCSTTTVLLCNADTVSLTDLMFTKDAITTLTDNNTQQFHEVIREQPYTQNVNYTVCSNLL